MKGDKRVKTDMVVGEPISADALEQNQAAPAPQKANSDKKQTNKSKKAKPNEKKDNWFVRFFKAIGRKFKEMGSELKKVSWPKFSVALKSTGIVLLIVAIFLVVLTGMDFLLGWGFSALV